MVPRVLIFSLFLALVCSACVNSPRNGDTVFLTEEEVTFSGYLGAPETPVNLQAYDFENNHWVPFTTFVSQSDPQTDALGTKVYWWEGASTIPGNGRFWRQDPDSNHIYANLRAVVNEIPIHSFDKDADSCMEQQKDKGMAAVLKECQSPESPVITVQRPCGYRASACCKGNADPCRGETACNGEGICTRAQWEANASGGAPGSNGGSLELQEFGPGSFGSGFGPEDLRGDPNPVQYPGLGGASGLEPPDDGGPVDHSICRLVGEKRCCASPGIAPGPEWCQDKYLCQSDNYVTGVYRYGGGYVCGACWGAWTC